MNIIGLIEMHPFDGTDAFICLRVANQMGGVFDLPITQEQLSIVINNLPKADEEDASQEAVQEPAVPYEPTNASFKPPNTDEGPMVLDTAMYQMGQTNWEDDDL